MPLKSSQYLKGFRNLDLKKAKQTKLFKLQEWFSYYKFDIEYIPSNKNIIVDSLIRELANFSDGPYYKKENLLDLQKRGIL